MSQHTDRVVNFVPPLASAQTHHIMCDQPLCAGCDGTKPPTRAKVQTDSTGRTRASPLFRIREGQKGFGSGGVPLTLKRCFFQSRASPEQTIPPVVTAGLFHFVALCSLLFARLPAPVCAGSYTFAPTVHMIRARTRKQKHQQTYFPGGAVIVFVPSPCTVR